MASGAVRELITKIKFQIDKASESKAKSTMQELKRQLNNFAKNPTKAKIGIDTTRATTALQGIKSQLNSLQGKTVTTYVQTKQKGSSASAVAKGGKGSGNGGNALADNAGTLAATGAAMVAPLALPVNTAMDFEAAMSKVKAITNSTDADMARLTATARELGASTQYSASEAAAAMSYLGMAGWKTEQIIAGMPGLLDLAAASGEDLARVADIVSDDLTAFKMPA
jgi:DNA-binding ferritin-like protein (Dps family)